MAAPLRSLPRIASFYESALLYEINVLRNNLAALSLAVLKRSKSLYYAYNISEIYQRLTFSSVTEEEGYEL